VGRKRQREYVPDRGTPNSGSFPAPTRPDFWLSTRARSLRQILSIVRIMRSVFGFCPMSGFGWSRVPCRCKNIESDRAPKWSLPASPPLSVAAMPCKF